MIFNSYAFLAFFPIVTLAYYRMPMRARRPWLLAASYYFYMCWNAQYALLIAASTLVTYLCALALGRMKAKAGRRAVLALGLAINLGILCFLLQNAFLAYTNMKQTVKTIQQSVSAQISEKVNESLKLLESLASLDLFYEPDTPWEEKVAVLDKINEFYGYMFICFVYLFAQNFIT